MMKSNLLGLIVTTAVLISCSTAKNANDSAFSKGEKAKGYSLLFDGKSMNEWRTYQNKSAESWEVVNGTLHCKGGSAKQGVVIADLITKNKYENFDLTLDWKISPKGNSGIIYMVTEDNAHSYLSGPEYQIIDDKNYPGKMDDTQHTAANYAMHPAPEAAPNPVGEWNHTRIVVDGNNVEHWLNGKKVVEYELHSPDWEKRKSEGKWRDASNYGKSKKGHIALQNHGNEAWFKNIKIKEL